jgi:hypothetical protein
MKTDFQPGDRVGFCGEEATVFTNWGDHGTVDLGDDQTCRWYWIYGGTSVTLVQRAGEPQVSPGGSEDSRLTAQAKAIVSLAFRNGPLEVIHARKWCPTCADDASFISDEEMKTLVQYAVDKVYTLLCLRDFDPSSFESMVVTQNFLYTAKWDDAKLITLA